MITYSADEITDFDELVQIGLQSPSTLQDEDFSSDDMLHVEQLLEERTYTDGTVEQDCVSTSILLSDELMRTDVDQSFVDSNADSRVSGYTVMLSMYYSRTINYPVSPNIRFRVDKVVTSITKSPNTTKTVTHADQMYRASINAEKWQTIDYSNNSTASTQTFTLYSVHSGFYESHNDPYAGLTYGVSAQATVDFSNGESALVQVIADEYL